MSFTLNTYWRIIGSDGLNQKTQICNPVIFPGTDIEYWNAVSRLIIICSDRTFNSLKTLRICRRGSYIHLFFFSFPIFNVFFLPLGHLIFYFKVEFSRFFFVSLCPPPVSCFRLQLSISCFFQLLSVHLRDWFSVRPRSVVSLVFTFFNWTIFQVFIKSC